jgi:FtsP/CotA-like multicopper oxidase with cupredoxin domain
MTKAIPLRIGLTLGLLATLLVVPTTAAHAATVPFELCATSGTTVMPDGANITVLGYVSGSCPGDPLTRPGGPVLQATAGDTVELTLHNGLGEDTAMLFDGQPMVPDLTGVGSGGTKVYSIPVPNPGTYLYEAGLLPNTQHQTAMGLYGALVVHPAAGPGQAYGEPATAYDTPGVADPLQGALVLSEIDPLLNNRVNPATFDMRNYRPRYWLINGYAMDANNPTLHNISVLSGGRALLRFVNAGSMPHSIGALGLEQTLISSDGGLLRFSQTTAAHTLAPGQSADALVSIPAGLAEHTLYALYDGSMLLHNSGFPLTGNTDDLGGMMTFLDVAGSAPGAEGPETSNADVAPSPTNGTVDVTVTATTSPTATAAEFFIDATGADGTGAGMSGAPGTVTGTMLAADIAGLSSGPHTIFVHAFDGTNWGAFDFATLFVDRTGPAITQLVLNPNPSNSSTAVALSGTANDSVYGGSNIDAAEYFVTVPGPDGTGTALTLGAGPSPVTSVATGATPIPGATPSATIFVHARDSLGNWGPFLPIDLVKDDAGPSTAIDSVTPSANNGSFPLDATNNVVRVRATFTDGISPIKTGEGFIKPCTSPAPADCAAAGAPGTGFPFRPTDGVFDELSEQGNGDIPLSTIRLLASGDYRIYTRAKDAAGNWGPLASVEFRMDRTNPAVTGVSASPNPTNTTSPPYTSATAFSLTATATDAGSFPTKIVRAEWYEGTDPGVGLGASMAASDGTFDSPSEGLITSIDYVARDWAPGPHTLSVRAMDAAGNWSAASSVVVTVVLPDIVFADGFESGNAGAWASTTGGSRFSVFCNPHVPPALAGTCSLQTTLSNGLTAYATDTKPRQDQTYHARFLFDRAGVDTAFSTNRLVTIFSGQDNANGTIFVVQLRRSGSAYQVRMGMDRTNAGGTFVNTAYVNLNPGGTSNNIEIAWQAGSGTGLKASFWVNRDATTQVANATLSGTTTPFRVDSVRLGPSAITGTGGLAGTLSFDSFVSTRRTAIGSSFAYTFAPAGHKVVGL